MAFSWTSFALEILNFLVLVWILKRFLYRPTLAIIARRRQEIADRLDAARREREAGEALRAQYEGRLESWEQERAAARAELAQGLERERAERHDALAAELDAERGRQRLLAEKAQREQARRLEAEALALGARFAARLLTRLSDPGLDARLLEMARDDLRTLPSERRLALTRALAGAGTIEVVSAHPLAPEQREVLEATLAELAGTPVGCRYREEPALVGGLLVEAGDWVLHANLRDALAGFAEAGRG